MNIYLLNKNLREISWHFLLNSSLSWKPDIVYTDQKVSRIVGILSRLNFFNQYV